jgi:hypothetical protein
MRRIVLAAACFVAATVPLAAQDHSAHCGAHSSSDSKHHADVDARGDEVMGFDHQSTTHGFRLTPKGGVIEVAAHDLKDEETVGAIRTHLGHIAKMFAEGDFEAPMLIHGQEPPGVDVMKRDKAKIAWEYVETVRGGRVVATTDDSAARDAIHAFLRFQIEEHRTEDSEDVQEDDATH